MVSHTSQSQAGARRKNRNAANGAISKISIIFGLLKEFSSTISARLVNVANLLAYDLRLNDK